MNLENQSPSPAFREYSRLLIKLHELIRNGEGDDEHADQIRDEMDGPWHQLTSSEIDALREFSAKLY